jgi:hypothetical protein
MRAFSLWLCAWVAGWALISPTAQAVDTGWMQQGVRVWYLGGVGGVTSSNAEEAFLIDAVDGDNVQVTHHSAVDHWQSPNPPSTQTYPLTGMGPCWIHPQALQDLEMGDTWMGHEITLVVRETFTYGQLPYAFLPAKALFDLAPQREVVKIVYMLPNFLTGTAYIDAGTGLVLQYSQFNGFVAVFFVLSEINYAFATQAAFAEDDGPHTGFKSFVSESSLGVDWVGGGSIVIQSLVESRYGDTVEMRVLGSASKDTLVLWDENHYFDGSVPILRKLDASEAPNYPPEQWDAFGEYLWWWVPPGDLGKPGINIYQVDMARTADPLPTFAATAQPAALHFTRLAFGTDGYLTEFSALDPTTGLAIDPGDDVFQKVIEVYGLDYYRDVMGQATPVSNVVDPGAYLPGILGPLLLP